MRQEPSGDENMALGGDGSCTEAGLQGDEIDTPKSPRPNTPELHRNERKDPSSSARVYENHFLGPAYERNVPHEVFPSLTIPWGKINGTSVSLKRLETFIEKE